MNSGFCSGDFVVVCRGCDGFLDDVKVDVEHPSVLLTMTRAVALSGRAAVVLEELDPPSTCC
jgi:hypothetical protein